MNRTRILCVCLTAASLFAQSAAAQATKKLTIDRIYSLPWIIGTKPEPPVWSPDSQRIAFLWNDEGTDFDDVWIADAATGKPTRITSMPRPPRPEDPGTDIAKLQQVAAAEADHGVSSVVWSHDAKHLLFTLHGELYETAAGEAAHRLAATLSGISDLASSPATNQLAFTASGDLYVLSLDTDKLTRLYTSSKKDVVVEEFHWSHDGARIAFVESDLTHIPVRGIPDYLGEETRLVPTKRPFPGEPSELRRLGIVSVTGGKTQWADLGPNLLDLIYGVSWSPDNTTLLIDKSDLYIKDRRLLLLNPATGKTTPLYREQDPKNVTDEWWSDWAPDGSGVYFTSDRDNDYHVYFDPLTGGQPRPITSGNFAVFSAAITPASKSLFVVTNEARREERHLYLRSLTSSALVRLTNTPGTHTPVPSPDGRLFADIFSSDSTPPDLYLQATTPDSAPIQVTHSPLPEFHDYHWSIAHYVDFPNVHDGTNLHARITLPPDFDPSKKYPAILGSVYSNTVHNQWGGRIFHPTWAIDQYLAQQGYVILNVDISGSSGYGKLFRQRIGQDYGGIDVDDLYSGVQYLIAQGFVDPHRVGIWGSSYGGLLTSMSLFTHPGVYQAGVAGAPATSLFHAQTGEMRTMMAPQDHMAQYAKSSAFLKSGGLEDHLLILHGMRDQTVLFKDSVTLEQRLILQGKDIRLVALPDAPHGWDTEGLAQTRYAYHQLVDYFAEHLGQGPTPEP